MSDPIDIVERLRMDFETGRRTGLSSPRFSTEEVGALFAEIDRLRADFAALQRALVGDTGASAILTAQRMRAALAQPAAPAVTADDFFTLLGHAMALRMEGQTDMPAYFYGLAERIAPDAEHAARARQLSAAPQAPQPSGAGHTKE